MARISRLLEIDTAYRYAWEDFGVEAFGERQANHLAWIAGEGGAVAVLGMITDGVGTNEDIPSPPLLFRPVEPSFTILRASEPSVHIDDDRCQDYETLIQYFSSNDISYNRWPLRFDSMPSMRAFDNNCVETATYGWNSMVNKRMIVRHIFSMLKDGVVLKRSAALAMLGRMPETTNVYQRAEVCLETRSNEDNWSGVIDHDVLRGWLRRAISDTLYFNDL